MADIIKKGIMRIKQADGTFIELTPQTNTDNVYRTTDGKTMTDIITNELVNHDQLKEMLPAYKTEGSFIRYISSEELVNQFNTFDGALNLIPGEYYTLVYNGKEYTDDCSAAGVLSFKDLSNGLNMSIWDKHELSYLPDEDDYECIQTDKDMFVITNMMTAADIVLKYGEIKILDPELLPDTVATKEYVDENNFSGDYNDLDNVPIKYKEILILDNCLMGTNVNSRATVQPEDFIIQEIDHSLEIIEGDHYIVEVKDLNTNETVTLNLECEPTWVDDDTFYTMVSEFMTNDYNFMIYVYDKSHFEDPMSSPVLTENAASIIIMSMSPLEEGVSLSFSVSIKALDIIKLNNMLLEDHMTIGTRLPGLDSLAEDGVSTYDSATMGVDCSLTVGNRNMAEWSSVAFGAGNTALYGSGAIGTDCIASGLHTFAQGYGSEATGYYAVAEGNHTKATGNFGSHAEGNCTIASGDSSHVEGKWNIEDTTNTYAHIVGNGTDDDDRSNAHTLDWDGNAWFAGNVSIDGTPTKDNDLITKAYVDGMYQVEFVTKKTFEPSKLATALKTTNVVATYEQSDVFDLNTNNIYKLRVATISGGFIDVPLKKLVDDGTNIRYVGNLYAGENNTYPIDIVMRKIVGYAAVYLSFGKPLVAYQTKYTDHIIDTSANIIVLEGVPSIEISPYVLSNDVEITNSLSMNRSGNGKIGSNSAALGGYNVAEGNFSLAEGIYTVAKGFASHAEGRHTIASSEYQHVEGKFNIEDAEKKYAHIVGNGNTVSDRSNAHTLDWNGNAWFAGNVTIGTDNKQLATQEYVDENQIARNNGSIAILTIPKADMDTMLEDGESELSFSKITYDENRTYYIEYDGKVYPSTSVSKNYIEFNYYDDDGFYVELDSSSSNSSVMCFYYFKYYLGYVDPEDYEDEPPIPTTATDMVIKYDDVKYLDNNLLDENLQVKNSLSVGVRNGEIGGGSTVTGAGNQASGTNSFAQGEGNKATGLSSSAMGSYTTAEAPYAHAEGYKTSAFGTASHVEGIGEFTPESLGITKTSTTEDILSTWKNSKFSLAKGKASHVEGRSTLALNSHAHAEGYWTIAEGSSSHAEGEETRAGGWASHAEGIDTVTTNSASHAEGENTIASGYAQHVQGKWNIEDAEDKYAHIVGNGDWNTNTQQYERSNAHTLDWDGNAWYAGSVKIGDDNKELATQEYVDDTINYMHEYDTILTIPKDKLNELIDGTGNTKDTTYDVDTLNIIETMYTVELEDKIYEREAYYDEIAGHIALYAYIYFDNEITAYAAGSSSKKNIRIILQEHKDVNYKDDETKTCVFVEVTGITEEFTSDAVIKLKRIKSDLLYDYATKEYVDENIFSGDYNDLVNTPIKDSRNCEEFYYTFDGDVTSYETVTPDDFEGMEYAQSYAGGDLVLVRISDSCPPVNNIYGDIELGILEGEDSSTFSVSEKNIAEIWVGIFAIYDFLLFIPNDIGNIKQGIYVLYIDEEYYVNSVRFMASYTGEFIQLDNKYLQDHITIGTRSEEDVEPLSENGVSTFETMKDAGDYSLTVGLENKAESSSIASGYMSKATGECSFASGYMSKATGEYSYAGGFNTESSGESTHAEGNNTTASGDCSHAEGFCAEARGGVSHAEGISTIASGIYQHVQGRYNIEDTENKYAHIVGNGKNDSSTGWKDVRSNAHTLDWDGNAWFAGNVSVDGTPTNDKDLTTKKYVDEKLPTIISEEVVFTLSQADLQAALDSHNREEGGCYITVDKFPIEDGKNYYMTLNGKEYQPSYKFAIEPYTELYFDHCADDSEDKTSINFYGNYINNEWVEDINKILIEMHYDIDINTDLSIITREVKALDNKMLDRDLKIENSLSMNRNGSIGYYSTALGYGCQASGFISYAEGERTIASNTCSHAEGYQTIASGPYSHAEGHGAIAKYYGSHAEGNHTIAGGRGQHVQGRYNIEDTTDTYAHIVGNGAYSVEQNAFIRSNAHTLDWEGNAWFAGNVTVGEDNKELVTKEYVDDAIAANSPTIDEDELDSILMEIYGMTDDN